MNNHFLGAIENALADRAKEVALPALNRVLRVRALLDAYEVQLKEDAGKTALGEMLQGIGQPAPVIDISKKKAIEDELQRELDGFLYVEANGTEPEVPDPLEEEEVIVAPDTPVKPTTPPLKLTMAPVLPEVRPEVLERANKLIAEIEGTNYTEGHAFRLAPLIQAHAAEVRDLMSQVSETLPLSWQLSQMIPKLSKAKKDSGITGFVKGLARRGRTADWRHLAMDCRRAVAKFDADALTVNSPKKNGPKTNGTHAKKEESRASMFDWPKLPKLRARMQANPLFLVGGGARDEKVQAMQTRFGVAAEWHEIDDSSTREVHSILEKIKKGRAAGVICLEGLISHPAWKDIQEACKLYKVPFAEGDRAGIGSLEAALTRLEAGC